MGPLPGDTSVPTTTPVRDFRARQRDARRRDAQARFNAVAEDPLHDARVGSDKWRLGKEAVMKEWKMYVSPCISLFLFFFFFSLPSFSSFPVPATLLTTPKVRPGQLCRQQSYREQ
jgi:hypothetical protein